VVAVLAYWNLKQITIEEVGLGPLLGVGKHVASSCFLATARLLLKYVEKNVVTNRLIIVERSITFCNDSAIAYSSTDHVVHMVSTVTVW